MTMMRARLLILCKTYPSPSSQYVETSCVAAMNEAGHLVRLFPVPFRLMEDENQFKKWRKRHAELSITHMLRPEQEADLYIGQSRQSTPDHHVSGRRISGTCEIAAQPRELCQA
jgi:hypothetical protein